MHDKTVTIIGMGEIGTAIYDNIARQNIQVSGVDANQKRILELQQKGYNVTQEIPESDVYILAVYTTDQVIDVIKKIYSKKPLISIEATVDPSRIEEIKKICTSKECDLVIFPHRFNPNDPEHCVFNLHRVLGADDQKALQRASAFYEPFIKKELLTAVSLKIAALSKILENTHRFLEIAIAQTYKESCDRVGIDFNELRKAANTKWNIDIKEARDGIKGKCLSKDANILSEFFKDNQLLKLALQLNDVYVKKETKN